MSHISTARVLWAYSTYDLEEQINKLLSIGFEMAGPLIVAPSRVYEVEYIQVMVKLKGLEEDVK